MESSTSTNNSQSKFIFFLFLIVLIGVFAYVWISYSKNQKVQTFYETKETNSFTLYETQNFSTKPITFRLNVQSHDMGSQTPQKVRFYKKGTTQLYKEISLVKSQNPNECMSHSDTDMQMMEHMQKWDSEWFSIIELSEVTNEYSSKLANMFDMQVIYQDGGTQFASSADAPQVCFQISESVQMTPSPDIGVPRE